MLELRHAIQNFIYNFNIQNCQIILIFNKNVFILKSKTQEFLCVVYNNKKWKMYTERLKAEHCDRKY